LAQELPQVRGWSPADGWLARILRNRTLKIADHVMIGELGVRVVGGLPA